ncbi:MAG: hypothetical protein J7M08_09915 [Planctomycetes bacterium]|nr:hypothetical protein [Planctomycetota bacterium]
MRPRKLGRIIIIVLMVMCLLTALIYTIKTVHKPEERLRGIAYAVMALTFGTVYRYLED